MKAIVLNNCNYCKYPEGIENIEQFVDYCNQHYYSFLKLTQYSDENCCEPYFIENEFVEHYFNVGLIHSITEENITVLSREEYDNRLKKVVLEKCVQCEHFTDDFPELDLDSHKGNINLDGYCWRFEKKSE